MNNMAYEPLYERTVYKNKNESKTTPLGATNLNKMDYAISEMDNRIVELDENKVSKDDVIPVENGGTGASTAREAEYNIFKDMASTASSMSDMDQIAMVYTSPDASKGVFLYRQALLFWNYIKSKISSVLGLTATNYKGTAAKATADANGNTITETYVAKTDVIAVDKGGTGATTAKEAQYNLLNDMNTVTTDFVDTSLIASVYTEPKATTGTICKRTALAFWNYIKSKISSNAKEIEYITTSGMTESIAGVSDETQIAFVYVAASETQGRFYWRKATYLWDYIKSKANSVYATITSVTPVNNLLATTAGKPLDAVQGKALDERLAVLEDSGIELLGSVTVSSGSTSASKTLDIDITQYKALMLTLETAPAAAGVLRDIKDSTIAPANGSTTMNCTYINFGSGTTINSVFKGKYNQSTGELSFNSTTSTAYQEARLYGIK